jgi:hypothetical protein
MIDIIGDITIGALVLNIIVGLIYVNVYNHRRRAKMTPEERKRDDEETRRELQIW